MKKSVIFMVNGRKGIDLDVKLPIALGFQKKGYRVIFIAWASLSKDSSKLDLLSTILTQDLLKIYTLDKMLGCSRLISWFNFFFPFEKKNSFAKRFIYKFTYLLTNIFSYFLKRKIKLMYYDALFVSAISTKDYVFSNNGEKLGYILAKKSNLLFLGLPTVVWPHYYLDNIYPFDAYLVNCKSEKEKLINQLNFKGEIIFEGCPSFEKAILGIYSKINFIFKIDKANVRGILLFILVNRSNEFNRHVNVIDESKLFIKTALNENYKIIVKYHPADIHDEYAEFRANENFIESNEPIEKLVNFVDASITLLSTAILKSIALNLPSFLLINQSIKEAYFKNSSLYNSVYFKDNRTLSETWIDDYCYQFNSFKDFENKFKLIDNNEKYNNFVKDFDSVDALDRTVKKIIKVAQSFESNFYKKQ